MKQVIWVLALFIAAGCGNKGNNGAPPEDAGVTEDAEESSDLSPVDATNDAGVPDDATAPPPAEPVLVHDFGNYTLEGGEEVEDCAQWTLNNDKPLYVDKVTMSNDGGWHHSNWLIVPDTAFAGPDGYFDCDSRRYTEVAAAVQGTVLVAQSTQSREEVQDLPDGFAIKIPPYHKIIAGVHLLNLSPRPIDTGMRMRLDLVHPKDVEIVATPFRLSYYDLHITPEGQSRFTGTCDLATPYEAFNEVPLDMKLYWVLPHYHALGNYFRLELVGGPRDGEVLFELEGFNAEANGKAFPTPIDLTGATGLRFTCGFNNPRAEEVGWGIGDQEMCVMLGLTDSRSLFDAGVNSDSQVTGTEEGFPLNEGPCTVTMLPKNDSQAMPTQEEIDAPLYAPSSDEDPGTVAVVPECEDTPAAAEPKYAATLSNVASDVLAPSCTFSSCHDAENPAFGLDLATRTGMRDRLVNHAVQHSTSLPLVAPGDAEGSWLYQMISKCDPMGDTGTVAHMPRNSPTLLDPGLVAMVRAWIDAGAADD